MAAILDRVRAAVARRRPAPAAPPAAAAPGPDEPATGAAASPAPVAPAAWRSTPPLALVARTPPSVARQRAFVSALTVRRQRVTLRQLDHARAATIGGAAHGIAVLHPAGTGAALEGERLPELPSARRTPRARSAATASAPAPTGIARSELALAPFPPRGRASEPGRRDVQEPEPPTAEEVPLPAGDAPVPESPTTADPHHLVGDPDDDHELIPDVVPPAEIGAEEVTADEVTADAATADAATADAVTADAGTAGGGAVGEVMAADHPPAPPSTAVARSPVVPSGSPAVVSLASDRSRRLGSAVDIGVRRAASTPAAQPLRRPRPSRTDPPATAPAADRHDAPPDESAGAGPDPLGTMRSVPVAPDDGGIAPVEPDGVPPSSGLIAPAADEPVGTDRGDRFGARAAPADRTAPAPGAVASRPVDPTVAVTPGRTVDRAAETGPIVPLAPPAQRAAPPTARSTTPPGPIPPDAEAARPPVDRAEPDGDPAARSARVETGPPAGIPTSAAPERAAERPAVVADPGARRPIGDRPAPADAEVGPDPVDGPAPPAAIDASAIPASPSTPSMSHSRSPLPPGGSPARPVLPPIRSAPRLDRAVASVPGATAPAAPTITPLPLRRVARPAAPPTAATDVARHERDDRIAVPPPTGPHLAVDASGRGLDALEHILDARAGDHRPVEGPNTVTGPGIRPPLDVARSPVDPVPVADREPPPDVGRIDTAVRFSNTRVDVANAPSASAGSIEELAAEVYRKVKRELRIDLHREHERKGAMTRGF